MARMLGISHEPIFSSSMTAIHEGHSTASNLDAHYIQKVSKLHEGMHHDSQTVPEVNATLNRQKPN